MTALEQGFVFFLTTQDLGLGDFSDQHLLDELQTISQDAAVFSMSRIAQVLHFCGELDRANQIELAKMFFNKRGFRKVRQAFESGKSCFITYEGATRLALLAVLHSPNGSRTLDKLMGAKLAALVPAVHSKTFTNPTLQDPNNLHSAAFLREARLQMFIAGGAGASATPIPAFLRDLHLGALIAMKMEARLVKRADRELMETLGITTRELHAMAMNLALRFAAVPEGEQKRPENYKDALVLNGTDALPKLAQEIIGRLTIQVPVKPVPPLAALRSPRTAWPEGVGWRPFYISKGQTGPDTAVCWDIRSLHNMISWGFPYFAQPFLSTDAFGGLSNAWNSAFETIIQAAVVSSLPGLDRPRHLEHVEGQPDKQADWIGLSGEDGLVVEFKNASARPATFLTPSPEYFENWTCERFITGAKDKPEGLVQAYITILRAVKARPKTLARQVADAQRIWPIVVTPINLLHTPMFVDFITAQDDELRAKLPPLPSRTQRPTLMDLDEFLAFATLPIGTHGETLREFQDGSAKRMWSFGRYLFEKLGEIPENPWLKVNGDDALTEQVRLLEKVNDRLESRVPGAPSTG